MGPLQGLTILELAGIGPGPFCGMMLADMGAEVIRIERASAVPHPEANIAPPVDPLLRNRLCVGVDLKSPDGVDAVLRMVESADGLIEGFRPGVTERMGLGPDVCRDRNPKLVYGRMTGWGQTGPYANAAGHDLNYIALAGVLETLGRAGEAPVPPLNLVGDFGGGGMYLAFGMVCGILEAQRSGQGQVIDAAMVDGAASLFNMMWGFKAMNFWNPERGTNLLDTGAYFYDVYQCADGGYVSVGSIEPQFYRLLIEALGLADEPEFSNQMDRSSWPARKERITAIFRTKTRDEWCAVMEHTDICFAPVLSPEEATQHPHNVERGTFIEVDGVTQAGPAPRFSRTEPEVAPPSQPGQHTDEVLARFGFDADTVAKLRANGAVA